MMLKGNLKKWMSEWNESFQLCSIPINDTVNIHILLSVIKLSMFLSHSFFFFFFFFSLRLHISQFLPHIEQLSVCVCVGWGEKHSTEF